MLENASKRQCMAVKSPDLIDDVEPRVFVFDGLSNVDCLWLEYGDVSVGHGSHRQQGGDHRVGPGADFTPQSLDHLDSSQPHRVRTGLLQVGPHCVYDLTLVLEVCLDSLARQREQDLVRDLKQSHVLGFVDHS